MKRTSAAEVIIQALWPGPDVVARVGAFGWLFVTYASTSARRAVSSAFVSAGAAGGGGAAAGAAGAAAARGAARGSAAGEGRGGVTQKAPPVAREKEKRG